MIQTTKTLSASEVKNKFGSLVRQVQNGDVSEVVVENHGEPVAAIVAVKDLEMLKAARKQQRRKGALGQIQEARDEVQARLKKKLSDKEAMQLADRFSHEIIEDLAKEGKVKFERKPS